MTEEGTDTGGLVEPQEDADAKASVGARSEVPKGRFPGMIGYTIVWFGQLVSFVGTGMTQFGLVIWVWEETASATALSLMAFFGFVPMIVMMPFAGVLVDRWNLKWTIALVDMTAGIATVGMLVLFKADVLEIWHLYVLVTFAGAFQAFQFPAFSAATTMMVAKRHYGRASGMLMTAQALSMILAPVLAAILLGISDISSIFIVDIVTFLVALGCLSLVPIPDPPREELERATVRHVVKQSAFGFHYIYERKGLLGLQLILFAFNIIATMGMVLINPMILSKTGNDELMLGTVMAVGAVGGVLGGIGMSIWGGPKRKVDGVLIGLAIAAVGGVVIGIGRGPVGWMAGIFIFMSTVALCNGSNQAIWQAKVPPQLQGRVFATRGLIAMMGVPISQLVGGPLAEFVAEPFMKDMTGVLEWLFGSGAGAGMALIIFAVGVAGILVGLAGYLFPNVRDVEKLMPDHEVAKASEEEPGEEAGTSPLEQVRDEVEEEGIRL